MSESLLWIILLLELVCPYFELDIEQDEMCKALLTKQETERIESFLLLLILTILE